MSAFDDVVSRAEAARPRQRSVKVLIDHELAERHEDLDDQLVRVPATGGLRTAPEAVALSDEILALEDEIEAAKVTFTFRAIGRRAWSDLIVKHPPKQHHKAINKRADHNPETFPLAAMAACCIEPEGATAEGFKRLDEVPALASSFDALWTCCIDAQAGGADAGKSTAAGVIRRLSERSGARATAADGSLPEASSSDE